MEPFDLSRSLAEAERRLPAARTRSSRAPRADAGKTRLPAEVIEALTGILRRQDRPSMHEVQLELAEACRRLGKPVPARATIYRFLSRCPPRLYRIDALPEPVQRCLYNLDAEGVVPGHQLAFYAFNYGDARAMSFAAGLPWLELYQADRMRGWRPASRGLLRAVLRRRAI